MPSIFRSIFFFAGVCLWFISCAQSPQTSVFDEEFSFNGEAISLLGDTLKRPAVDEATRFLHDSLFLEAHDEYLKDSHNLDNIIWLGRRLAYMHHYKEAIAIYSRGIGLHPEAPELYRHRGHRLLTVRKINEAIDDLQKGITLSQDRERESEPDGIPNKLNIPLSNLHFNLYYHLGLGYFLNADYKAAISAYTSCMKHADNPDLIVATTDWLYLSYMRSGDTISASQLLETIHPHLEIIENDDYLQRLLIYKGEKKASVFTDSSFTSVSFATRNYGISCWHEFNNHREETSAIRRHILEMGFWPAFGYLAAEADSARIR